MPTFKIKTLGCKVNQYESQARREAFLKAGLKEELLVKKSDIYLINTCTVTARTDGKSLALIREALRENPKAKVMVTGCFAKAEKETLVNTFGTKVNIVEDLKEGISAFANHSRAFLKIQDGCNNKCSYCKIPLVRGNSRSRNFMGIIEEARHLIERGFKEIVLCGICLGAYGRDLIPKTNLSDVILALIDLKGDFRIRLSSIEVRDVSDKIIEIMSEKQKLCRHLHIPFQAGDDSILKRMNRKYTSKDYLKIVENIRREMPEVAITTDIMVGFPGETEENFKNSLNFLKKAAPARTHCFPFSARPGTAAFNLNDKIPDTIVNKRMLAILKLTKRLSLDYQRKFIGKKLDVLIEAKPDRSTGFFKGYSDNYIYTLVKAKDLAPGEIVSVRAKFLNSHYLVAEGIS